MRGSIRPFSKQIEARSRGLFAHPAHSVDKAEQIILHGYLDTLLSLTNRTVSELHQAGMPRIQDGKQVAAGVVEAFSTLASITEADPACTGLVG